MLLYNEINLLLYGKVLKILLLLEIRLEKVQSGEYLIYWHKRMIFIDIHFIKSKYPILFEMLVSELQNSNQN